MPSPFLLIASLLAMLFTIATQLVLWREQSVPATAGAPSVLEQLMGDSRRLFANHFLTKADVYLHSGVYPSIFDRVKVDEKSHLTSIVGFGGEEARTGGDSGSAHELARHDDAHLAHDEATAYPGPARDWLDAFGRNFYPVRHTHLSHGEQRELLPWLRLSAELNPNQVETYTVGAYWLRYHMGKVDEAERFLREGWRANPRSFEILFELGRLYEESRNDSVRARNLLEGALRRWDESGPGMHEPDEFGLMQITGHLAQIEESQGHLKEAIRYLSRLSLVSPHPEAVAKRIQALQAKLEANKGQVPGI